MCLIKRENIYISMEREKEGIKIMIKIAIFSLIVEGNINGKKIIRDNCIVKSCFRVTLFFKELNKS